MQYRKFNSIFRMVRKARGDNFGEKKRRGRILNFSEILKSSMPGG
jgi:hypothetical protein